MAAGGLNIYKDSIDSPVLSANAEYARPRLRAVVNGVPFDDEDDLAGQILSQRESDDEDWPDSTKAFKARLEARMDSGYGPFPKVVENGGNRLKTGQAKLETRSSREQTEQSASAQDGSGKLKYEVERGVIRAVRLEPAHRGLKKLTPKQIARNLPPTPRGCEWRRSDDGLSLWRCRTEWNDDKTRRIKKSRYAGHLSDDAWRIMKEYDYEAFISTVGERLRRHGGR